MGGKCGGGVAAPQTKDAARQQGAYGHHLSAWQKSRTQVTASNLSPSAQLSLFLRSSPGFATKKPALTP